VYIVTIFHSQTSSITTFAKGANETFLRPAEGGLFEHLKSPVFDWWWLLQVAKFGLVAFGARWWREEPARWGT
jgi:hypothetical protein